MASMLEELRESAKDHKTQTVSTTGIEYVKLAKAPTDAVNFVFENLT